MEIVAAVLPVALASGVNLYLTVFVIGITARFELISGLPEEMALLASWPIIIVSGVMYAVEALADKIPFLDSVWDVFHTVIRPAGAFALTTGLVTGLDPTTEAALALAAGGTALTAHGSKMGFRAFVNTSPEPVSNVAVSTAEDIAVLGLIVLALNYPLVAAGVAAVILTTLLFVTPHLFRWARFWFIAVRARMRPQQTDWDTLPQNHRDALPVTPRIALQGRVRGSIPGASGRNGYLSASQDTLYFTYDRWFGRVGLWQLPVSDIHDAHHLRGLLMNMLDVEFGSSRRVRFVFLKDRADMARRFADLLDADPDNGTLSGLFSAYPVKN